MRADAAILGPLLAVLIALTAHPRAAQGWNPFIKENGKVKKGNKLVEKGKPEEAVKKYDAALAELSDNAAVHYNKGVALVEAAEKNQSSKDSSLKAAAQSLMSAIDLAGDEETGLKADAFYNLGNAYFLGERWQEAAEAYRQSLKLKPGNRDAAHNLSMALKKIEEEKRKKEEEEKKKKEEEEKKEQEQEQQDQQEQQQQEDQQKEEEEKQEEEKKDDQQCDQGKEGQKQEEKQQEKEGQEKSQQQKEQEKGQQQEQQQQKQQQEQQGQQQQQQEQEKGKGEEKKQEAQPVPVTQQQAEAILDALQRGEKNFQLENLKQMKAGKARVLKDW